MKQDLDALDANWDDEPEAEEEEHDLDALDAGWDHPRKWRTAAEKAAARKEKARLKAERQRSKAASVAQKQKRKQKRKSQPPPAGAVRDDDEAAEADLAPAPGETRQVARARRNKRRDWIRMLTLVGVIIALAAFIMFLARR